MLPPLQADLFLAWCAWNALHLSDGVAYDNVWCLGDDFDSALLATEAAARTMQRRKLFKHTQCCPMCKSAPIASCDGQLARRLNCASTSGSKSSFLISGWSVLPAAHTLLTLSVVQRKRCRAESDAHRLIQGPRELVGTETSESEYGQPTEPAYVVVYNAPRYATRTA